MNAGYPLPTDVVALAFKLPVAVALGIKLERRFSKLISTSAHCTPDPPPPPPDPPLEQPSPQRVLNLRKKTSAAFRMACKLNGPPKVFRICGWVSAKEVISGET